MYVFAGITFIVTMFMLAIYVFLIIDILVLLVLYYYYVPIDKSQFTFLKEHTAARATMLLTS